MSRQTSPIKFTRASARGYTLLAYACFDCGRQTKSVQLVWRAVYSDGSRGKVFVCRKGTGCHKATDPYAQPSQEWLDAARAEVAAQDGRL